MEEVNNTSITIQDHVTVKIINSLHYKFETYIMVLNKKAYYKKNLLNLDLLLKSLEEKELCIIEKTLLSNVKTSFSSGFSQNGLKGQGREGCSSKVVVVTEVNVTAKVEVKVKITICQSTKILHAIAAKRQDTLLVIVKSQPQ